MRPTSPSFFNISADQPSMVIKESHWSSSFKPTGTSLSIYLSPAALRAPSLTVHLIWTPCYTRPWIPIRSHLCFWLWFGGLSARHLEISLVKGRVKERVTSHIAVAKAKEKVSAEAKAKVPPLHLAVIQPSRKGFVFWAAEASLSQARTCVSHSISRDAPSAMPASQCVRKV